MKIKIVTTERKLTKSLVNQMQFPLESAIRCGTVLGFLVNVAKLAYKVALIQDGTNYYISPTDYTKGEASVYRTLGKWSYSKKFDTPEKCDNWWQAYTKIKNTAIRCGQIYI